MPATTIPTVPSFASNDSSLTNLQNLAYCAQFLAVSAPHWQFYSTASTAVPATTATTMPMEGSVSNDESAWTSPGYITVQTLGYYMCSYTLPVTSGFTVRAYLLLTPSASSPYFGGGARVFALQSSFASTTAIVMNGSDMTPICCYPGDTIKVVCFASGAVTQVPKSTANGHLAASGALFPAFSGRYVSYGT